MDTQSNIIKVGRIGAPFGVKGWVHVHSISGETNFYKNKSWFLLKDSWTDLGKVQCSKHGKGFIAKIEGCDDRNEAMLYTNKYIGLPKEQLPKLQKNEYYWDDLIGCEVESSGKHIGKVIDLKETGANDVFVVEGETRELIPFVMDIYVLSVDTQNKKIVVDW